MEGYNLLADFAWFIQTMDYGKIKALFGRSAAGDIWRRYKETDPFTWYLTLTIAQADKLYGQLYDMSEKARKKRESVRKNPFEK